MKKASYTFVFGTGPGQYPPCSSLVDSVFGKGEISYIVLDNQSNNRDYNHHPEITSLDLSAFTISSGTVLTVIFAKPV